MPTRYTPRHPVLGAGLGVALIAALAFAGGTGSANAASLTTAWQNGAFSTNVGGVVSRSDVVLGEPNSAPSQSMPLGNGSLGVAAWAANGFTAQLNRSDTMPSRLSPGQVNIPGLAAMTSASNFTGHLDLYNGVLDESGGGMTLQAWVPAGKDELVVEVTGAAANAAETATLSLWSGRSPTASASGAYAALAQTWVDNSQTGNSGQTFGAMAAITAGGSNVTGSTVSSTQVKVSFNASSTGTYSVVVAAPQWTGGTATSTASSLVGSDASTAASTLLATQSSWWNNYWANVGLIEANSSDGSAQYMENLRTLYLYDEAASMKSGAYPGSQAGVADMFAYDEDQQDWYPAGYWLWNLRGQIAANLSSGDYALNVPIFTMYLNDLPAIESWTSAQMGGKAGACIPETMRFNGNGYYNGGSNSSNASCATASSPSYNAENVTSGAELAMWIWQQYQDTGSKSFLQTYYPILEQTATFLLAYQSVGSDGFLHATANAHESQWAVTDPTTDLVADQALFPAVIQAATILNTDSSLVSQLRTAENEIEPLPRVSTSNLSSLLNAQPTSASAAASLDAAGNDAIGDSYQPSATIRNSENIGLEPVWPWGVIGDDTTVNGDNLTALADRTYSSRPDTDSNDWTFDAVDAARLDNGSAVASDLVAETEKYQYYVSGLAAFNPSSTDEPYIEQSSTVATTLDEALATDYDGTIRFAPAWPSGWDGSGTVYIQGGSKLDVQMESGTLATAAIQAGTTGTLSVRNPWSGAQAEVVNGSTGAVVVAATTAATLSVPVTAGSTYLVEQPGSLTTSLTFAQVTGSQATQDKVLGGIAQIGLPGNAAEGPYGGSAAAVPGTVQAENYDTGGQGVAYSVGSVNGTGNAYRGDGVDLETTSDTGGGYDLGWTSGGQWFKYTVNVATAGTYTVALRVAAPSAVTDALHIANSSGTNLSGNLNIASTGGWQTWTTVNATVTLPAGTQTLTVDQDNGGWNVNSLGFTLSSTGVPLASAFNNVAITADTATASGNFDGGGASFSETALTNAGAGPGAQITSNGVTYTFPNVAAGSNDNAVAEGQLISLSGSAADLGFLVSGSYGPATGTGTINYTDGSTQSYTLTVPDWFSTSAPSAGAVAVNSTYQNRQGNTTYSHTADIFSVNVALASGKTVASVTLPAGSPLATGTPAIHVFALALG
ncbi:carbohydrate-binding protein [Actinospica durhamensis]|uniref:Carbohydrate-binding protein n=1 Tax=Actinospica durhamensis TaxID=1508375 RepID=A0A941IRP9_9ACTN|nr:carbohydrate-binding protein [Actinospica durhamensis]MBR7837599.1 carbohydrate-binding protein [Actinospica durhamensis]